MKNIAVLCFENPFNKPNDGAKNDMRTRILALVKCNKYCIDVYAFNKSDETEAKINCMELGINELYQFKVREGGVKALLSKMPISVFKRYTEECCEELSKHSYDAIIYEGEHMASYRFRMKGKAKKHILRQHDIESEYRKELSRSAVNMKNKVAQLIESYRYKWLERKIDTFFDKVLFISNKEKEQFEIIFPQSKDKFVYMPPATRNISEDIVSGEKQPIILYFGNMKLNNNVLSVVWFAENVFIKIVKEIPDAEFRIIGDVSDDNKLKLQSISDRINVKGYVENLNNEISEAAFIATPVLYGAGVKVKVIDAIGYGQIVCATNKAIEGTELVNGNHIIIEDDGDKLANKCTDILKNRKNYERVALNGLELVKNLHSIEYQSNVLNTLI